MAKQGNHLLDLQRIPKCMSKKIGDSTKLKVEYSGKKDELMDRKDGSMDRLFTIM